MQVVQVAWNSLDLGKFIYKERMTLAILHTPHMQLKFICVALLYTHSLK